LGVAWPERNGGVFDFVRQFDHSLADGASTSVFFLHYWPKKERKIEVGNKKVPEI
jgi:hypothetical protein